MSSTDYNRAKIELGLFTEQHIAELVRLFQIEQKLPADGKFGPATKARLESRLKAEALPPSLSYPLPTLPGDRLPKVTSAFRTADRPNHNGVDMFYRWQKGDVPDFVGDHGCASRTPEGDPKWVVPYGVDAIAAAPGKVMIAGNSLTGWRCWIDHGNGYRTGYFHLLNLKVKEGDRVTRGQALGLVGDNPSGSDGRHLHFELSPVDRYAPIDPAPYLVR